MIGGMSISLKIPALKRCVGYALACVLALSGFAAIPAAGETPPHGLMWNRTGLPAVFPLQMRSRIGADYYMVLSDAQTGAAALSGYIEGGRFFKVLVPPGLYKVAFATGTRWQDEERLFGAGETRLIEVPEPLRFGVVGLSTKAGHVIDLRDLGDGVIVRDSFLCQGIGLAKAPRPQPHYDGNAAPAAHLGPEQDLIEYPYRAGSARENGRIVRPPVATDYAPYFSRPEYEVRRRPC